MYGQKEITESYVCTTQDDKIETQITFK
jgi:hypothetical protein